MQWYVCTSPFLRAWFCIWNVYILVVNSLKSARFIVGYCQNFPWNLGNLIITKICLFEYIENFTSKNWNFSDKKIKKKKKKKSKTKQNSTIFHISAQNIYCGYSLEPPRRKHTNIILSPLTLTFFIVKLGFRGVYIIFLISAQKHRLWVLVRTASFFFYVAMINCRSRLSGWASNPLMLIKIYQNITQFLCNHNYLE